MTGATQTAKTGPRRPPRPGLGLAVLAAVCCWAASGAANVQANPQQASTLNGAQQAMAQMLQVFNGNDSQQLDANHFKLLELVHGDSLLVGARNVVYNLSLSSMREQRRLEWQSNDDDVSLCQVKGKSRDQCQNYIRVLKVQTPDTLLVCGTNAYKPRCRTYLVTANAYELLTEEPGEGLCPYKEDQNVTSTLADGELYSATAAQFNGIDGLIHRRPLRTEQFNPKQLNSPNFVSSFRHRDHVYFVFREIAVEHINCGKTIYSRIARVCINDLGGATRANRERWTSFAKARLNCSIPGDFPFYFDEVQAATGVLSSAHHSAAPLSSAYLGSPAGAAGASPSAPGAGAQNQELFYAVFTTPLNSIGGSAVCAYRMRDVEAAFEGPFKSQLDGPDSNWLPVPEGRVPKPRPGTCANDSKRLPDETVNFLKDNPLMDQAVEPIWSQPLITMASLNFRFTQIVVDVQVAAQPAAGQAMRTDVLFVATDDGRVFKLTNSHHLAPPASARQLTASAPGYLPWAAGRPLAAPQTMQPAPPAKSEQVADVSQDTLVVEELHLFDARTPIVSMLLHYPANNLDQPKLVVASSRQLKAIPLSRCERAPTCADCLALHDPYCVWDLRQQACLSAGRSLAPPSHPQHPAAQFQSPQFDPFGARYPNALFARPGAGQPANSWFPANSPTNPPAGNHSLAWWQACPGEPASAPLVGAPFRSLFASHLQVPSRFDYQSGHHLAHTSLLALGPAAPTAAHPSSQPPRQPVSECLTFCGGVYSAPAAPATDQLQTISQLQCADLVQQATSHYTSAGSQFASQQQQQQQQHQQQQQLLLQNSLYTSENLYLAVIACAGLGLSLGLLFGFAMGKNSRKRDPSICSSTFDETNLYMASTGSHHAGLGPQMFANQHHAARLHQQHSLMSNGGPAGYLIGNGALVRPANGATNSPGNQFDASQCLLGADMSAASPPSVYGNQQQLLGLANATGAARSLPPLPGAGANQQHHQHHQQQQQQPLVDTTSQHIIHHSQLTPPDSTGGAGCQSTSSTSTTLAAAEQHNQLYLNQSQLLGAQQTGKPPPAAAQLHQRSFTNSSIKSAHSAASKASNGKLPNGANAAAANGFQQQQLQQLQAQQQLNNKIYL